MSQYYVDLTNEFRQGNSQQFFTRGKFILLTEVGPQDRYLVRSPIEWHEYHANILEYFLNTRGVKGSYNKNRDHYTIKTTEWSVNGGGHWDYDPNLGAISVYGRSLAYGACDLQLVKDILEESEEFNLVSVS